jgi:hypothetical protein
MACDCETECDTNLPSTLGVFGRAASKVISGRVTIAMAKDFAQYAAAHGLSQSSAIRVALAKVAAASDDPEAALTSIKSALGLPDTADATTTRNALNDLLTLVNGEPGAEATTEQADPPSPPAGFSKPRPVARKPVAAAVQLTSEQRAALKRRKMPETPAAWAALTKSVATLAGAAPVARAAAPASVAPLSPAEIRHCERANIPGPERRKYLADRAAAAVKRPT